MWPDAVQCLVNSFFEQYHTIKTKRRPELVAASLDMWLENSIAIGGPYINRIVCNEWQNALLSIVIVWTSPESLESNRNRVYSLLNALNKNEHGVSVVMQHASLLQ